MEAMGWSSDTTDLSSLVRIDAGALVWSDNGERWHLTVWRPETNTHTTNTHTSTCAWTTSPTPPAPHTKIPFFVGCTQGFAGALVLHDVKSLLAVCHVLRPAFECSLELLEASLRLHDFEVLARELPRWKWMSRSDLHGSLDQAKAVIGVHLTRIGDTLSAEGDFVAWTKVAWPLFEDVWKKCTTQQLQSHASAHVLESLVATLCTLQTPDHQSLIDAVDAMQAMAECGGVAQCVARCLETCSPNKCVPTCSLRKSLTHTYKEKGGRSGNVKTLRTLARTFECVLDAKTHSPSGGTWFSWAWQHQVLPC
jgi:hypothetical protein